MANQINCWACDALIDVGIELCPECQMPQETGQSQEELSIEDLIKPDSMSTKADVASISFDEGPAIPTFDDEPAIPSFDDEPAIPSFDDPDSSILEDPHIPDYQDPESDAIVEQLTDDMPFIPDFDSMDFGESEIDQDSADEEVILFDSLIMMKPKKLVIFYLPQFIYWTVVFLSISLASVEITDHNFNPVNYKADDFNLYAEFFLFSWISFLPMGWYFGFRIRKLGLEPKIIYAVIYLILQGLFIAFFSYTGIYLINGQFDILPSNSIMSIYLLYTWYSYIIGLFSVGIFFFFLSYYVIWENIFEKAPLSKIAG